MASVAPDSASVSRASRFGMAELRIVVRVSTTVWLMPGSGGCVGRDARGDVVVDPELDQPADLLADGAVERWIAGVHAGDVLPGLVRVVHACDELVQGHVDGIDKQPRRGLAASPAGTKCRSSWTRPPPVNPRHGWFTSSACRCLATARTTRLQPEVHAHAPFFPQPGTLAVLRRGIRHIAFP